MLRKAPLLMLLAAVLVLSHALPLAASSVVVGFCRPDRAVPLALRRRCLTRQGQAAAGGPACA